MKLEVGMHVRTKYNGIFNIQVLKTIKDINCDYIEINYINYPRNELLKASHNIIDLIEVGDYVNGFRVVYINHKYEYLEVSDEEYIINKEDIKSIVTKEQFESMSYKVQ
jgi:hypothetical protein